MSIFRRSSLAVMLSCCTLPVPLLAGDAEPVAMKIPAPAFAGIDEWINSKPLTFKDLMGRVVVVHFWAFG